MTRTDVVASSRPQKAHIAPTTRGSSSLLRRLVVVPIAFALTVALVLPASALAAEEGLSGYSKTTTTTTTTTTPAPATTPTTSTPTPTTGTSPSKESSTPTKTTAPETTSKEPTKTTEPTATTAAKKATSLPFTGFDLRWTVGLGLLLLAMGVAIVVAQRRSPRRRDDSI
jgi:hypothetical protein